MPGESTPRWYALVVCSRLEKLADKKLQGKAVESFLPLVEEVHAWSDKKKKVSG